MTEPDWLAIPEEDKEPAKIPDTALPVVADLELPPTVSDGALVASSRVGDDRREYARAWRLLSKRQRAYIRALQRNSFSHAAALKVANAMAIEGERKIAWATPARWAKEHHEYKVVLAAAKAEAVAQVVTRDDLLLRAHRAAEYAEAEQPILHQGQDTGFRERQVGEMLKANEQLMKATKVLGGEEKGPTGATGPALVIQVVQRDGALVDVTPGGVTIDLPRPRGD